MPVILWMKTCRQILIALSAGNCSKGRSILNSQIAGSITAGLDLKIRRRSCSVLLSNRKHR
jgi:hypothetical protein